MSQPGDVEQSGLTPEGKAILQAAANQLVLRATDVAARMQSLGMPMDVTVKRGTGPTGDFSTNVSISVGVHAQIALYEVLCDILESREKNQR